MTKRNREPEYVMSDLNTPMLNYRVYYMDPQEKVLTFLAAFIIGGIAGLTFYGWQFRDADGIATTATSIGNIVIFIFTGIIASLIFFPMRRKTLKKKRQNELKQQFRSLLEALAISLSSGMNIPDSLLSAYNDLKVEYSEKAYMVKEVKEMLDGLQNNVPIEKMMIFLGERSQIKDIQNFGTVFEICYRAGGNMKDIIRRTNGIISEKIEISEEIETALSSNKSQFSAMMIIPVGLVLMLRMMSSSFSASFATVPGIIAITIAIGIFIAAYRLGQRIMDIRE